MAPLGPGPCGAATLGPGAAMSPESIPANACQVQKIVGRSQGGRSHLCLSYHTLGVPILQAHVLNLTFLTPLVRANLPFTNPCLPVPMGRSCMNWLRLKPGPCQLNLLHHDNPRPELDPHLRLGGVKSKRGPLGRSTNARTCKSEAVHVIRADRILADRLANHPPVAICLPTK